MTNKSFISILCGIILIGITGIYIFSFPENFQQFSLNNIAFTSNREFINHTTEKYEIEKNNTALNGQNSNNDEILSKNLSFKDNEVKIVINISISSNDLLNISKIREKISLQDIKLYDDVDFLNFSNELITYDTYIKTIRSSDFEQKLLNSNLLEAPLKQNYNTIIENYSKKSDNTFMNNLDIIDKQILDPLSIISNKLVLASIASKVAHGQFKEATEMSIHFGVTEGLLHKIMGLSTKACLTLELLFTPTPAW